MILPSLLFSANQTNISFKESSPILNNNTNSNNNNNNAPPVGGGGVVGGSVWPSRTVPDQSNNVHHSDIGRKLKLVF